MEITMTEFVLFVWALAATLFWQQAKFNLNMHRLMAGEILMSIAKGKIKVVETEGSFDLQRVKQ
jgi:hypothetical protein